MVADIKELRKIISEGKDKFIEKFINRDNTIGDYDYDFLIIDYLNYYKLENTNDNRLKALREVAENIYYDSLNELMNCERLYQKSISDINVLEFIATIHDDNFTMVYKDGKIQGGIVVPGDGIILFDALYNDKNIDYLNINVYYDISLVTSFDEEEGLIIDYNNIDKYVDELKLKGVFPSISSVVSFDSVLLNNDIVNIKPLVSMVQLKDALIETYLTRTNKKNR